MLSRYGDIVNRTRSVNVAKASSSPEAVIITWATESCLFNLNIVKENNSKTKRKHAAAICSNHTHMCYILPFTSPYVYSLLGRHKKDIMSNELQISETL